MTFWPEHWSDLVATVHPPYLEGAGHDAIGCLDEASLVIEGGGPRGWLLRGWAALREGWSHYGELGIVLLNATCSFQVTVARELRADVAQAHAHSAYGHSGYRALIPIEPLMDGDYTVAVQISSGSRAALLDTGRTLSVRNASPWLPELHGERLLQVVHVPKTAGTSFQRLLENAYGNSLVLHYEPRFAFGSRTRCIQGHNYASNFLAFAPDIRMAMWFRDPVERLISEYFHWRRNPETHPLDGADLLSFARRREMVNVHRRCLDGVPLSRIDCVCITEHFRTSIELFGRMFDVIPAAIPPLNTNPDKTVGSRYDLSESVREQIALANLADIDLYERAKERFAQLCWEHGVETST